MTDSIEKQAKQWTEKLPTATDEELTAFKRWMLADHAHMRAFGRELKRVLQEARGPFERRQRRDRGKTGRASQCSASRACDTPD